MKTKEAFTELENSVYSALETYSNVHRGSGHSSMVSTCLYEKAREIVLEYLGQKKSRYAVIFCSPSRESFFRTLLQPGSYMTLSSADIGLPLGIRAIAIKRKMLPAGIPFESGGGNARLVSREWVIWTHPPEKFEAGTPPVINVIAFAKALLMIRKYGTGIFREEAPEEPAGPEILHHDRLEKYSGRELLEELRKSLIGRNLQVPAAEGSRQFVNLDNSASTQAFASVWETVCQTWRQPDHIQKDIVREVRSVCAAILNAPGDKYDIIFTSNATEAINLAARSFSHESSEDAEPVVLSTLAEHSSNDLPWRTTAGNSIIRIAPDDEGFFDLNELESLLKLYNREEKYGKKRIILVAISGASNVLGIYNDLAEISRIVHLYGARLLVDAAQVIAHRKVDIDGSGIDYLAFSAHKVYAPFGCGVLVAKRDLLTFSPDEMLKIRESGEENTAGIAALGKSLVLLQRVGMDIISEEEQSLTKKALKGLAQINGLTVYGLKDPDSPSIACKGGVIIFGIKGVMPDAVAKKLALYSGVGVRYGCHCAHMLIKYLLGVPPGLEKFQRILVTLLPRINLPGLVRVSFGIGTLPGDIDTLLGSLARIAGKQAITGNEVKSQVKYFIASRVSMVYYNN